MNCIPHHHSGTIADSTQPFGIGDYSQTPGTYEFQGLFLISVL